MSKQTLRATEREKIKRDVDALLDARALPGVRSERLEIRVNCYRTDLIFAVEDSSGRLCYRGHYLVPVKQQGVS